ncbi:MAG: DNA mismatch repair protein MutH [Myxococcota bacterium]
MSGDDPGILPRSLPTAPTAVPELLDRARALAGRTLADIAKPLHLLVPPDLSRRKGWVGNLIEVALGASAGSKPTPDFERIGVELKTIPIGANGTPRESTFVTHVAVDALSDMTWESSFVRAKLHRVLWVPIQADPKLPLAHRRVGMPLLWRCEGDDEQRIEADWQRLTDQIRMGFIDSLTGSDGEILHMRPKALDRRETRPTVGEDGWLVQTLPRGFYLRARFTAGLLARHYAG